MNKLLSILVLSLCTSACFNPTGSDPTATIGSLSSTGEGEPSTGGTGPGIPTTTLNTTDNTTGEPSSTMVTLTDSTSTETTLTDGTSGSTGVIPESHCSSQSTEYNKYGGDGSSPDKAFEICTVAQLKDLAGHPEGFDKHFKLMNDLDFAAYYKEGNPTFKLDGLFTGSFIGNEDGKTISGFILGDPFQTYTSLFTKAEGASFAKLTLTGFVLDGGQYTASLVGACTQCRIEGVHFSNLTISNANGKTGGLIAHVDQGILMNQVTGTGLNMTIKSNMRNNQELSAVGGVIGSIEVENQDVPDNLAFDGITVQGVITHKEEDVITAPAPTLIGGIGGVIGLVDISNVERLQLKNIDSKVDLQLGLSEFAQVGGIVGTCDATDLVENTKYEGTIQAINSIEVGGILGLSTDCTVKRTQSTLLAMRAKEKIGGLVGRTANVQNPAQLSITQSQATVKIDCSGSCENTGGLVGEYGTNQNISRSSASVEIIGIGKGIGGLIGYAGGNNKIEDSFSINKIEKINPDGSLSNVGGIIGALVGTALIQRVYTAGESISGNEYVGGLVGRYIPEANETLTMDDSFSVAAVRCSNPYLAGGLLGEPINLGAQLATNGNVFYWPQPTTEQDCFQTFVEPGCIVGMKEIFFDVMNDPLNVWDFVDTWGAIDNDLPILKQ